MPSKIESQLTPEQVVELLETLVKTPGGHVLRVIQAEAEKRGITVSPMGASSFRDATLHPYIVSGKKWGAFRILATANFQIDRYLSDFGLIHPSFWAFMNSISLADSRFSLC